MSWVLDRLRWGAPGDQSHRQPLSAAFDVGCHAIVAPDFRARALLAEVLCGESRAQGGRSLMRGQNPFESPGLRAKLGCSWVPTKLPREAMSARELWVTTLAVRSRWGVVAERAIELLDSSLLDRPLGSLAPQDQARLFLELALGLRAPEGLLLGDVLDGLRLDEQSQVIEVVGRLAEGAPVLFLTATRRQAALWTSNVVTLGRR